MKFDKNLEVIWCEKKEPLFPSEITMPKTLWRLSKKLDSFQGIILWERFSFKEWKGQNKRCKIETWRRLCRVVATKHLCEQLSHSYSLSSLAITKFRHLSTEKIRLNFKYHVNIYSIQSSSLPEDVSGIET